MSYKKAVINGKEYPVSFGMNALALFSREAGLSLKQIGNLDEHLDLYNTMILVWCGLSDGFRKARKAGDVRGDFALSIEDVGDLLDTDPNALDNFMKAFNEAQPQAGNGKTQATTKRKKLASTN